MTESQKPEIEQLSGVEMAKFVVGEPVECGPYRVRVHPDGVARFRIVYEYGRTKWSYCFDRVERFGDWLWNCSKQGETSGVMIGETDNLERLSRLFVTLAIATEDRSDKEGVEGYGEWSGLIEAGSE